MVDALILCGHSIVFSGTKPAGAYIIAESLRNRGLKTQVIDMYLAFPKEKIFKLLEKFLSKQTKYVLVSTTLGGVPGEPFFSQTELDNAMSTIFYKAKSLAPFAKFIIGGSKIRYDFTNLPFDYAVRGPGEIALEAILNHVELKNPLLYEKTNETKYVSSEKYPYSTFNSDLGVVFRKEDCVLENETLPIEIARGCIFKCSYCDYELIGKKFRDFTKTEDILYETLMYNYEEHGITRYVITDDTVNDSIEKIELMHKVSKKLPFKWEFGGYFRIEPFSKHPEMASLLLEAGLVGVNFGIETFNKVSGSSIGKGFGDRAKNTLDRLKEIWGDKVIITINIIIGLPHDTLNDIYQQHEYIKNSKSIDVVNYHNLIIWRDNDKLFYDDTLDGYYKELPESDAVPTRYKNWVSPIMNCEFCIKFTQQLNEDFKAARSSLAEVLPHCFVHLALMRKYTLQMQQNIDKNQIYSIQKDLATDRLSSYYTKLLSLQDNDYYTIDKKQVKVFKIYEK